MERTALAHRLRTIPLLLSALALIVASACATTRGPGRQVSDAAITTAVESKLMADPETNMFEIGVDTVNGVVRLSGIVDDPGDRNEAEKLARNTDGVKRVINDISVGSGRTAGERVDDATITTRVKSRIAANEGLTAMNVDVDTEGGVVTLFGQVNSRQQAEEAARLARETQGVRGVRNRIMIKGSTRVGETPEDQ